MNYINHIKNWHSKASDEDYFSKFTFEYLAFIAYLMTQKFSDANNERDAVQKLKQDADVKKLFFAEKRKFEESYNTLKNEFDDNARLSRMDGFSDVSDVKWWNHVCPANSFCGNSGCGDLPNGQDRFTDEMKGKLYGDKDWVNLIEFWVTIRNNLFHGGKNPEARRDKLVVEHGYKTLRVLMDVFLRENS